MAQSYLWSMITYMNSFNEVPLEYIYLHEFIQQVFGNAWAA